MKRDFSGISGLAGLGLSRSMLRTIGSAQSALCALDRVGGIGAAARAAGTPKAGAGLPKLVADVRMEGIAGMGAGSAWSTISAVRKTNSSVALGKSGVSLPGSLVRDAAGTGLKGIAGDRLKDAAGIGKFPLPSVVQAPELGKASRAYPALDALLGQAKGAYPQYSAGKVSDLACAIPKSAALGIPRTTLGAGYDLSAARSAASFLGSGTQAGDLFASAWKSGGWSGLLSGLPKDVLSGASVRSPGLLGADAAGAWRDVITLSKTSWLFGPLRELGFFGVSGAGFPRGAFPALRAFDAVRRASGLLDAIGRIDLEALRKAALIREARRPRTKTGFAALEAYDGFCMNHPWVADEFLLDYLCIEPDEDTREALWLVLRWTFERTIPRPVKWLMIDDEGAIKYLRTAIYRNAKRVRRDKERPDRVWWTRRDPDMKKRVELPPPTRQPDNILELMMERSGDPADIVVPVPDDRGLVLERLYVEGTEQDKMVVGMIIAGFDLAAIAHAIGWSEVQRFQRKAQRWKAKLDFSSGG